MTNQTDSELIFEDTIVGFDEHDGSIPVIAVVYVTLAGIIFLLYSTWNAGINVNWTRLVQVLVALLLVVALALLKLRQNRRRLTVFRQFFLNHTNNTLVTKFIRQNNEQSRDKIYDLAQLSRLVEKKHRGTTALYLKFGIRGDGLWITQISLENKARIKMVLREYLGESRWIEVDFEEVLKAKAD